MFWLSRPGVCFESKRKVIVLEPRLRPMWPLPLLWSWASEPRRADDASPLMRGVASLAMWLRGLVDIERRIVRLKEGRAVVVNQDTVMVSYE